MTTALERLARGEWLRWANYRKWTACAGCGEFAHCGAARPAGPFRCLPCFDQGQR